MSGILKAACAIIDDLVGSGSFLSDQVSACDYGILDKPATSGCAVVLQPGVSSYDLIGYGGISLARWSILAECYVRDTGDVPETLGRVWQIHDVVKEAIDAGSNINPSDNTRTGRVSNINRPQNVFVEFGGNDFIPIYVTIEVKEDP